MLGVGVLGSASNPFSTAIASNAAGIPFTQGIELRLVILAAASTIAVLFVMRYAGRVREDPTRSVVADMKASNEAYFLKGRDKSRTTLLTGRQQIILILVALTFAVMIWGVASQGWWTAQALFKAGAATRVIACKMPKSRAAMHLDTVFSVCNRDVVTSLVKVAAQILCFGLTPDDTGGVGHRRETKPLFEVVADCLELKKLHVIPTGGDSYEPARAMG